MTADAMQKPPLWKRARHRISGEVAATATRAVLYCVGALLLYVLTPVWDKARAIVEMPERLERLEVDVATLTEKTAAIEGEDRIIRMPEGQSYILEPVAQGEAVTAIFVLERTKLGASCIFLGGQSLFMDQTRVRLPGSVVDPTQQATADLLPYQLTLTPPAALLPGRIELTVNLTYDCGGQRMTDTTKPLAYRLLPMREFP